MALRLPDTWVWDFWLARRAGEHHVFYLQAPRSLGDPELRHHNASIGHAVSPDLRTWTVLPDALRPGPPGAWDDLATWTGSVIEHDGRWHMLYTGISRAERGLIQRIGLAVSDDLTAWRKHPANPVLQADGRWYELLDLTSWRTFSYSARAPAGPYRASAAPIAPADGPLGTLYAGKLAEAAPGDWRFLAFCASRDGAFAGELTDPLPIRQDRQGTISIAAAHG